MRYEWICITNLLIHNDAFSTPHVIQNTVQKNTLFVMARRIYTTVENNSLSKKKTFKRAKGEFQNLRLS